jgi:chromosome segregation ATPase
MEMIQVKVEQIATWVGLFTAVAGAAANYGITENKVATLEQKMSELYNVEEIRVLERRLTTLEVSLENVKDAMGGIEVTDTSEIQSRTSVNQSRIRALQSQVERIETAIQQIRQKLDRLNSSPL